MSYRSLAVWMLTLLLAGCVRPHDVVARPAPSVRETLLVSAMIADKRTLCWTTQAGTDCSYGWDLTDPRFSGTARRVHGVRDASFFGRADYRIDGDEFATVPYLCDRTSLRCFAILDATRYLATEAWRPEIAHHGGLIVQGIANCVLRDGLIECIGEPSAPNEGTARFASGPPPWEAHGDVTRWNVPWNASNGDPASVWASHGAFFCIETSERRVFCSGENATGWSASGQSLVAHWEEIEAFAGGRFAPGGYKRICSAVGTSVICLGGDNRGGDPETDVRTRDIEIVETFEGVRAIDVADDGGCVVSTGGELWCWGIYHPNEFEQWQRSTMCGPMRDESPTGFGRFTRAPPVAVPVASGVRSVSVDGCGVCVLLESDEVACWRDGGMAVSPDNPLYLMRDRRLVELHEPLPGRASLPRARVINGW